MVSVKSKQGAHPGGADAPANLTGSESPLRDRVNRRGTVSSSPTAPVTFNVIEFYPGTLWPIDTYVSGPPGENGPNDGEDDDCAE
jgi:hypothetical protein